MTSPRQRPSRHPTSATETLGQLFPKIKCDYDAQSNRDPSLLCKHGTYADCHVLKLQKPTWTNDDMQQFQNQSGIFFSIWLEQNAAETSRANYNIHALKLRQLRGYKLTSRNFATDFRHHFAPLQKDWPNVSTGFGPQTLMQGWFDIVAKTFPRDVIRLISRFEKVSPIIDKLLKNRDKARPEFRDHPFEVRRR